MNSEIRVKTSNDEYRVFLQDGFFPTTPPTPKIHKHSYAEMHVVLGGYVSFNIDGKVYTQKSGDLLLIPRRIPHCIVDHNNALHTAFQISCEVDMPTVKEISEGLVSDFMREIEESKKDGNFTKISAFIALLCAKLDLSSKNSAKNITDYGFLIHEFFSQHYGESVTLSDLAMLLRLSERQAERLVIQYTSHTFGKELTATRMAMAAHLMNTGNLTLSEIAEYVGYRSYAGFWKAYKKHIAK